MKRNFNIWFDIGKIKIERPLIAGLSISLFLIYGVFNSCLIRYAFSIPCPSCGISRAWISVFKADIGAAFYYHPLFIFAPLLAVSIMFQKKTAIIILCALFAIVYLIRLCFFEIP